MIKYLFFIFVFILLVGKSLYGEQPFIPKIDCVIIMYEQPNKYFSSTIWYDDFEKNQDLNDKYHDVSFNNGKFGITEDVTFSKSKYAISQTYESGQVNAGWIWYFFGDNPIINGSKRHEDVYVRWYHKFEEGFQGVPIKMARMGSFTQGNFTLAFMAHCWMWNGLMDPAVASNIELNGSEPVNQGYNNFVRWLPNRPGGIFHFNFNDDINKGRWIAFEVRVKLNSPGNDDGIYQMWVDDRLLIDFHNQNQVSNWLNTSINAVQFDCYWNGGSAATQSRYYDNIIISTEKIGLAYSGVNPTIIKSKFADPVQNDYQTAWELQISSDSLGKDTVWTSNTYLSETNELKVNNENGVFKGSRNGENNLQANHLHYMRVRQRDNNSIWSEWSGWNFVLQTAKSEFVNPPTNIQISN